MTPIPTRDVAGPATAGRYSSVLMQVGRRDVAVRIGKRDQHEAVDRANRRPVNPCPRRLFRRRLPVEVDTGKDPAAHRCERNDGHESSPRTSSGCAHGRFVHRIVAELVELGGQELARIGRISARHPDGVAVHVTARSSSASSCSSSILRFEPGAKPSRDQERNQPRGPVTLDRLHIGDGRRRSAGRTRQRRERA